MSGFFSNKYLRFKQLGQHTAPTIATDVFCRSCSYNLRGLQRGGTCPECGRPIPLDLTVAADPLLSGDRAQRSKMLWGLTLLTLCCVAAVVARVGFSVAWSLRVPAPLWTYIACNVGIALAWMVGVFLVTPARLDAILPARRWLRRLARVSQIAWLASNTCWLLAETRYASTPQQDSLMWWAMILPIAGWFGGIALALFLLRMAEDVELDDAPRRIGLAIWVVPVLSVVLLIIPMQAFVFVLALIMPLLLAWAWYLIGFARGVWEMRQHVAWGIRLGGEAHDREARIAATRSELDREAMRQVRPLPAPPHAPPTSPTSRLPMKPRGRPTR
jgi:hypothetical protein